MEEEFDSSSYRYPDDGDFYEVSVAGVPVYYKHKGEVLCPDCVNEVKPRTVCQLENWYEGVVCSECKCTVCGFFPREL